MRYVLESGCEPVPESGVGVGRDMDQHACRGGQLDARADDECEERPESHEKSLRNVAPVVEQFAQHGARERAEDDPHGRKEEEPGEDACRGPDGSRARSAEAPRHPCGQEIVGGAHGDGHGEPQPDRPGGHLGVGGEPGAEKSGVAQRHARQSRYDAADDAQYRERESGYGEGYVHRKVLGPAAAELSGEPGGFVRTGRGARPPQGLSSAKITD